MKPKDALLERWAEILARKGDSPAIFNTRGEMISSFRQIDDRSREFESKMHDLPRASVLVVRIGNHPDWPPILIAALKRGVVVLPLEQSVSDHQRENAFKICNVVAAAVSGGRAIEFQPITTSAATTNWGEKTPSLLKLTSGTTAEPRAVRFRSEQLLADCDQICTTKGISEADLNFGVIPVSHSYGFSNLLTPLIARGIPMVLSGDRTPRAVLDDLARTNATIFPGMPLFYQAFCEMENIPPLSALRLCISAGAPLPLGIGKKFRERFGLSIHSFYGASECGGICYDYEAKLEVDGFVGAPMHGLDLEMVDPDSESSQVRVRSAAVGDGYFPDADDEKLGRRVFVPDDLLAREGAGFKIVGRVSDLINVAGKKVNPAEIEQVLLQFPGMRRAVAFGRPAATGLRNEEVAVCAVADVNVNEKQVIEFCGKRLSPWQVPKRVFIVDSIPANERGKTSRKALAIRFRH